MHVNHGGAYRNHVDFLFRIGNKLYKNSFIQWWCLCIDIKKGYFRLNQ